MRVESEFCIRALKAGASGYVKMDSSVDELIKAIDVVADGRIYLCEKMFETLAAGFVEELTYRAKSRETTSRINDANNETRHRQLSVREFQVMRLLGAGKTPTETARVLGLGKTTVATYRLRLMEKLNLQNNAEIMRYAVEHRLAG